MKKITLLLCMFIVAFGYSQTTLEDFESAPVDLVGFEGLSGANVIADPTGAGMGQVAELVVMAGAGQPWQGANLVMQDNYIDASVPTTNTVSVDVYSTTAFDLFARLAGAQAGAAESAADVAHGGTGWETLVFTFNESLDGTAPSDGEYGTFAIFPNWNGAGWHNPALARTIYIDNVSGTAGASLVPDPAPMVAAPASTPPAGATTVGIYGDQGNVSLAELPTAWSQAVFSEEMIAGDATWKFDGEFLGMVTNYTSGVDLSGMQTLVINYWTESDKDLLIKLVNTIDSTEELINLPTTVGDGSWQTVSVSLATSRSNPTTRAAITQILIDPIGGPGLFYVDNFYFHSETLSTNDVTFDEISIFPNPSNSIWNVKTGSQNITSINVFDVLGKQVISVTPNTNEASIDASELNNGIYLAKVSTANGTKTMKLVKN